MADLDQFLDRIAQIESAGGRYTNHPVIQSGIHKGMSAIGTYGIMPLTAKETAARSPNPQVRELAQLPPDQLKTVMEQNPPLQRHIAELLASRVLANNGGDDLKAAYAWNNGSNLSSDQISDDKLMSSPYVQKYFKASGKPAIISTPNSEIANANVPAQNNSRPSTQDLMQYLQLLQKQAMEPEPEVNLRQDVDSSDDQDMNEQASPEEAALKQFLGQ